MLNNKGLTILVAAALSVGIGATAGWVATKRDFQKSPVPTSQEVQSTFAAASETEFQSTEAITAEESTQAETTGVTSESGEKLYSYDELVNGVTQTAATQSKTTQSGAKTTAQKSTTRQTASESGGYEYAYAGFNPRVADTSGSWELLLVNRDYILPEDYEVNLARSVTSDSDSCSLDSRVAPHYNDMYVAARKDGITLTPVSGYRSVTRQRNNFENKISYYQSQGYSKAEATQLAAKRILPPGTSEHNAGLAMDICVASVDAHFENTKEYKWLEKNAANYGFVLRYPENKQDVTEITYEPWHWRYVGVTAAKQMQASGQCLEEYLGLA